MEYGNELYNRNFNISGLLDEEKVDIESILSKKGGDSSAKTMVHIHRLFKSLALIRYLAEVQLCSFLN